MNIVDSIIEKHGGERRKKQMKDKVEKIEREIGFNFPKDYRRFVMNYTGFENRIGKEFVRLWNLEELIEFNSDYGIIEELENTIGIGTNGGGEFIAIEKLNDKKNRIVLSPLIDLDKDYHMEIGDSFSDFLMRLENGIQWFN